ncbi:hypothetical protein Mp_6g17490 [Marchantia polymorpha subsp. ruderalis]|uniref:Uncharacterized protein n=2 Tax=Marchantia polymorpha TaxID=3197 RepID=A0AAF6BT20_MARPO|nr:hypothetical protein MARPO_0247s0002 [Marchantia polymorpha]BBN15154.1 hypothetical protein Mp_6g17490 [Marchantia polymorpha subsp. ruderalis]|eukprot:PTQ26990.1 hypothetical protein MARPO_0247s0002 [Marchantia polymorpha]
MHNIFSTSLEIEETKLRATPPQTHHLRSVQSPTTIILRVF